MAAQADRAKELKEKETELITVRREKALGGAAGAAGWGPGGPPGPRCISVYHGWTLDEMP